MERRLWSYFYSTLFHIYSDTKFFKFDFDKWLLQLTLKELIRLVINIIVTNSMLYGYRIPGIGSDEEDVGNQGDIDNRNQHDLMIDRIIGELWIDSN